MTEPTETRCPAVDLQPVLAGVIAAVKEAGTQLRAEFLRPGGPRGSGSHADIDAELEWFLRARLLALLPAFFRGEETGTAPAAGGGEGWCWLVDPHDGTAAFLKGQRGSAVSVALLRAGLPVLGVVYSPMSPDRGDDLIAWAEGCGPPTRNGSPVTTRIDTRGLAPGEFVFVSQDAPEKPVQNAELCAPARFIAMPGIAYRLARVAAGDGIVAVSLNRPSGHDYAAGHALLRAVGGVLLDQRTRPVMYSDDGRSQVEHCFGGNKAACSELAKRQWYAVCPSSGEPLSLSVRFPSRIATRRSAAPPSTMLLQKRSASREALLPRAVGALAGQVIGDSLGSLVEFLSPPKIAHRYPDGVRLLADGGTWGTLAGQPTDDSELALALARSLVARGGYEEESVARAYVDWLASGPFDVGDTTRAALRPALNALAADARHAVAATARQAASRDSQANGSLMRVSPIGIRCAGDPASAAALARVDSQLTHPNPVCVEACAAFCAAIATGVAGGDSKAMLASARAVLRNDIAGIRIAEVLDQAGAGALPVAHGEKQGWVLIALQIAFRQLLQGASFEESLVQVVGLGGDSDTNGAIAGALLGARHGREAIPAHWLLPVLACRAIEEHAANPRPATYWPDDLVEVAELLLPDRARTP